MAELGLYYYGARWYDPGIMRFTSPDTLIPDPYNPLDWNRYAYARCNPIRYNDPTGRRPDDGCNTEGCSATRAELEYARQRYNALNCQNGAGGGCPDFIGAISFVTIGLVTVGAAGPVFDAVGGTVVGWLTTGAATTATTAACMDGDCLNEIKAVGYNVQKSITVLGRYSAYIDVAKDVGGKVFSVPAEIWNKLSAAEQWALNQQFLDDAIARGDTFYLASKWANAPTGSFYRMELEYLFSKGYTLSVYQNYLIPPSAP
jgi:RHS repeat-associated protein